MSMGSLLVLPFNLPSLTTSGGNTVSLVLPMPVQVLQVGAIVTTAVTVTNAIISWNHVTSAVGSLVPVGTASFGTTTLTVGGSGALNKGVYLDVSAVKGRRIVYPGEGIAAAVTQTSTAGAVTPFVIVAVLGFNNADMRASVSGHSGSTTNTSSLAALTKVIA